MNNNASDIILLKMGEIVLKGNNRRFFEDKLRANARRALRGLGEFNMYAMQSTIYIEPVGECDMDAAFETMKKLFGVAALARAVACDKDKDAILETARTHLAADFAAARTFKVECRRADKSFPMTSIELAQYVGGELHEAFPHIGVDVHNPELTVTVEVRDFAAYVHTATCPGAGGMPVSSNGRAVTLLSGGIDSPVASYMIAKRGVALIPVHFFSFPYTSMQAKEKVIELARILTPWCGRLMVEVVPFTKIQEGIRRGCPEELFTIIMRRFMMKISSMVAEANGCGALVTGENLGQVASQTMEAMAVTEECATFPVLRPLIGFDKEEIVKKAREIGTFETSILPYEDCCTVFTPRHPRTKPRLAEVLEAEAALDVEGLCAEAFKNIERVRLPVSEASR